jgi:hypothetical protein
MAVNTIINAATLAITAWSIGDSLKGQKNNPDNDITVSLITGMSLPHQDANIGGSIPHIAAWDENGNRIGQYKGDANGHIDEDGSKTFTIKPTQNGGHQASPEYLLFVMQETDAICVSGIVASGNGNQWTWTGDMGYTCDAQWYPSKRTIGTSNTAVKCVWLDEDHSNGIIAKGLSLHMRDFTGDQALVDQYKKNQARLCQNSARMTFQPDIYPDGLIDIFRPPLQYTDDGGAPKNPNRGIDRKKRAYPDGTVMHLKKANSRRHTRDFEALTGNATASAVSGIKNMIPDHLVISNLPDHSAKHVCEHPTSLGPDFVSTVEKIFCDMDTGKWWPLCDATTNDACFDLDTRTMRNYKPGRMRARTEENTVPDKNYKHHEEW